MSAEGMPRQIWSVRLGPCWCSTRPGHSGSFDLVRWRIRHVPPTDSPENLVISTAYIPEHIGAALTLAIERAQGPWRVITHRICPVVTRQAAVASQGLVDVSTIARVHRHLDACIADEPEWLALAMTASDPPTPMEPPRRLASL